MPEYYEIKCTSCNKKMPIILGRIDEYSKKEWSEIDKFQNEHYKHSIKYVSIINEKEDKFFAELNARVKSAREYTDSLNLPLLNRDNRI